MRPFIPKLFLVLFCAVFAHHGVAASYQKVVDHTVTYLSPDHQMRAVAVYYRPYFYGIGESRIDLHDRRGHLLGSEDYACGGTQGFRVHQAQWSADSRFFVFNLINAGGHSPFDTPTPFYDARRRRFYSANTLAQGGAITEDHFRLGRPSKLTVMGREQKTTIRLAHLTDAQRQAAAIEEKEFLDRLRRNAGL